MNKMNTKTPILDGAAFRMNQTPVRKANESDEISASPAVAAVQPLKPALDDDLLHGDGTLVRRLYGLIVEHHILLERTQMPDGSVHVAECPICSSPIVEKTFEEVAKDLTYTAHHESAISKATIPLTPAEKLKGAELAERMGA